MCLALLYQAFDSNIKLGA